MKNIFKTVAIITIFTIFTRASGFIFRIFMTRAVGAEGIGMYQIAFSIFTVLVTIVCSGIPLTVSRLSAKYATLGQDKSKFKMVTSAMLIAGISATFLCLILILGNNLFASLFTEKSCMLILITMLPAVIFSAVHGVIRGYLWGEDDYLSVCVIELIEQYVRIIACVIALCFSYTALEGALSASFSLTIAILVSCVCILVVFKKKGGKFIKPQKANFKEVFKSSLPITSLRFISSLMMPLISIIIPLMLVNAGYTNEQALSLFGIAIGMAYPLIFLPTTIVDSLSIAMISSLASALAENNNKSIKEQVNNAFTFSAFISCLCFPIFAGLGEGICIFLFDSALAGQFLCKASILIIPLSINSLTTTMLNSLEMESKTFKYFLFSSIALILIILFAPAYVGIDAVIYALFFQSIIIFILNLRLLVRKEYLNKNQFKKLTNFFIISLICTLIAGNVYHIMSFNLPLIIALAFSGIFCVLCYSLFCQIIGLYDLKIILTKFGTKKLHKKR